MNIQALVVKANDGKILFAEGIEDAHTETQICVPLEHVTESFLNEVSSGKTIFTRPLNGSAIYAETQARKLSGQYGSFSVEITDITLPPLADLLPSAPDGIYFSVLIAVRKSTGEILFAEGTDPDGYRDHHIVSKTKATSDIGLGGVLRDTDPDSTSFAFTGVPTGYQEAKGLVGDYLNVSISIRHIKL